MRTVIRLQGGRPANRGWTSDNGKRICLQNVRTTSCAHPMSYSVDTGGCSPGHGAVGREADYSNTSATDVSGQPIGSICTCQALFLNMGPIGCSETSVTTNQRHITSQKSKNLIYTAAEACSHAHYAFMGRFFLDCLILSRNVATNNAAEACSHAH